MLQDLSNLINVAVTYFDSDFNSTSAHSTSASTRICSLIKTCRMGNCSLSDQNAFNLLQNTEKAIYYTCHFGFMEMAFHLTDKNNTSYGYILIGPFRAPNATKQDLSSLEELCKITNADYKQILQYYHKITRFSLEKFYSLKKIIYPLFEYMELKNFIYEDKGYFTNTVEPFILNNLTEELSISYLCSSLFFTQKQLYKIFERNTNRTPRQYIKHIRMREAKKLIISTEKPLSEISSMVGFPDYNYFIKLFKAQEGVTPLHYRNAKK